MIFAIPKMLLVLWLVWLILVWFGLVCFWFVGSVCECGKCIYASLELIFAHSVGDNDNDV